MRILDDLKDGLEKGLKDGIDPALLEKVRGLLKTMDLKSALKTLKVPEEQWSKIESLLKK